MTPALKSIKFDTNSNTVDVEISEPGLTQAQVQAGILPHGEFNPYKQTSAVYLSMSGTYNGSTYLLTVPGGMGKIYPTVTKVYYPKSDHYLMKWESVPTQEATAFLTANENKFDVIFADAVTRGCISDQSASQYLATVEGRLGAVSHVDGYKEFDGNTFKYHQHVVFDNGITDFLVKKLFGSSIEAAALKDSLNSIGATTYAGVRGSYGSTFTAANGQTYTAGQ